MTVGDHAGGAHAAFTTPARADHSRFVQRLRRRYAAEAHLLDAGAPTREAQLATPLFERHPRGMVLTAAGEILATHARRAALDAERALGIDSSSVAVTFQDATDE